VAVDSDGSAEAWNPGFDACRQAASSAIPDDDDDNDGMTYVYGAAKGLDLMTDDAGLDLDGDSYSDGAEFAAGTAAGDPADNPGRTRVILDLLPMLLDID
jgi:hypothetical protein